jgi:Ser/Thr protein kinase RdoA (MazF antagonist)
LLHGDFWPGNTVWRDGRLVAVIDWEEAAFGDPLADLAVSRLDILWIFGLSAMNDFTQQYRSVTGINVINLPYWDLYAALRPASHIAEWAAVYPPLGRPDITEETMREGHRLFVTQAFETLTMTCTARSGRSSVQH